MDHCCLSDRGRARRVALTPAGARQTAAASTTPPAGRGPSAPTSTPPGGPQPRGPHSHRSGPRAPCSGRRRPPPRSRTPGRRRSHRHGGAPRDRPPPCSRPRSPTGEGTAEPPRPALPLPNPPETSVCSALPVLRQPTALATTRRPLRAAHAASGWRAVSRAAATSRLRELGPAATQRQAGDSPERPIGAPPMEPPARGGGRGTSG